MDKVLKQRLRVTGEMAEKFLPQGFCRETLALVDVLPPQEAARVLESYDFFLRTQQRYQEVAHNVYQELKGVLTGDRTAPATWRLDFLVELAYTPYEEEYIEPLRRAYTSCRQKPSHLYSAQDVRALMEAIAALNFVMQDSPSYPSERALKFYQLIYSGGALKSLSPAAVLSRILPRAEALLEEHRRLRAKQK